MLKEYVTTVCANIYSKLHLFKCSESQLKSCSSITGICMYSHGSAENVRFSCWSYLIHIGGIAADLSQIMKLISYICRLFIAKNAYLYTR